ncbi:MAG TPA: phosphatase PAP2 family protein [Candidatus Acidoferrales bacterium]|nr:phosphatase PAP2 family protein [Candidatus Acidoferrales bacterium]
MATLYHRRRISRRALPGFFTVVFICSFITPVLHSQDFDLEQPSSQGLASQAIAVSELHADEVAQTVPADVTSAPSDGAAQDPQNPEPKVQNNPNPAATYQPVTWKNLPIRVLGDQKLVWLFPLHLAQGQHILPTIGVVGVTGGLLAADAHIMVHVRNNTSAFHEYDEIFSGTNTGIVTALIPATFYIYGIARKSSYSQQTALLMGEAYLDSAIPHVAMKLVSRRLRPDAVPASSDFTDTFFKSHVSVFGKGSSFPSGHAAGIFSIATVVAERYRNHRWVPWVAYGLAAAISFSRVPTFAHFPSDVFLGAALGYSITRFDVLRDRTH